MKDIIEISSSEEEEEEGALSKSVARSSSLSAVPTPNPTCRYVVGSYNSAVRDAESEVDRLPNHWRPKPGPASARERRIVHSSSSSSEDLSANARTRPNNADISVIEITDSSDDDDASWRKPMSPPVQPPCQDLTNSYANPLPASDDALLVLDEPKSSRKPLRRPQTPKTAQRGPPSAGDSGAPSLVQAFSSLSTLTESDLENTRPIADDSATIPSLFRIPAHALPTAASTPTPKSSATKARAPSAAKTPRTSKKALVLAEQAERAAYAQSLFEDLNLSVFDGGLPATTTLVWSNRLLTTAGRARWHRSKEGVHTTSIELATKILDSNERIRNTLSHEMCHLACWVINQDPKEGHGKVWKSWAAKVMRKRADIDISTRHNYEISYPFEWECENCAKTYGRFSKSIRPDEVVCGACKIGTLRPLFTVRTKTPRKIANSQMAARSPRDSPQVVGKSPITIDNTTRGTRTIPGSFDDDSEEFDLDELSLGIRRLGFKDQVKED
ncbi:SprT-like family-domain-containing protein [Lactarius indigo]|nr:SprT-like family-domain-containing protein [Lactarius indigo]